jgi:hypothetical protein
MVGTKMILSIKEVAAAYQAMVRIGNMPLHPRTSYWMSRNWQHLRPIAERIEKERNDIIIKHGTKDEATGQIIVLPTIEVDGVQQPNPAVDLCTKALEDLVNCVVVVSLHKLPMSGFMGNISLMDTHALSIMIEEEVESNLIQLPKPKII